jgi:glycosyltransferase involved in cell wall biosynthesis
MKTLHAASKVHTISNGMRAYLAETRGVNIDRFVVVRNWQDEREFTIYQETHPIVEDHPFTFMYMGNVGALAGLDVVIDAFVKASLNGARLVQQKSH